MRESMKVPCDGCSHDRICHEVKGGIWICEDCEELRFVVEDSKIENEQYPSEDAPIEKLDQEPGLRGLGDHQEQI